MSSIVNIKITDGLYTYGRFKLESHKEIKKIKRKFTLDCLLVNFAARELKESPSFRRLFAEAQNCSKVIFLLVFPTHHDLIDYRWNEIVHRTVHERLELDNALSWLSTLGGAFSALGDYFERCAQTAGRISYHQFELAMKIGDEDIISRCRLYASLSLIQMKKFKLAKRIILNEYERANSAKCLDPRLAKMCKGIWAKLRYEHDLHRKSKPKT